MSQNLSVLVHLTIGGKRIGTTVTVPAGGTVPQDILPACRALETTVIETAAGTSVQEGRPISCRAGCGACCRQLVPVTRTETRDIAQLVAAMPDQQRTTVLARFAQAKTTIESSGLMDKLRDPRRIEPGRMTAFGLEYFHLGIPCPFLENESCSIYENRPLICREYLVTSSPHHCANPTRQTVKCVKIPTKISDGLARLEQTTEAAGPTWVPLVLALEWAQSHPNTSPPQPGAVLLRQLLQKLTGKQVPVRTGQVAPTP